MPHKGLDGEGAVTLSVLFVNLFSETCWLRHHLTSVIFSSPISPPVVGLDR